MGKRRWLAAGSSLLAAAIPGDRLGPAQCRALAAVIAIGPAGIPWR